LIKILLIVINYKKNTMLF